MTDDFSSLYSYNCWANDKMLDACRKLTADQFAAEPAPGWTPVRTTLWHIAIVTEGWLKAVSDIEHVTFPAETITAEQVAAESLVVRFECLATSSCRC